MADTTRITSRGIRYATPGQAFTETKETGLFANGIFTTVLTGLSCGTVYQYQAYAADPGNTGLGEVKTVTTAECGSTSTVQSSSDKTPKTDAKVFTDKLFWGGENTEQVRALQVFLNAHGFVLATSGAGSPGNESTVFGKRTWRALKRFQEAHADVILTPQGKTEGTGVVGPATMALLNELSAAAN